MKTQNGISLSRSRAMNYCQTHNNTDWYIKWGLGETQQEGPKYYLDLSYVFGTVKCVKRRHSE